MNHVIALVAVVSALCAFGCGASDYSSGFGSVPGKGAPDTGGVTSADAAPGESTADALAPANGPTEVIRSLAFSPDGAALWVGYDGGLARLQLGDGARKVWHTQNSGLRADSVRALLVEEDQVWVGYGHSSCPSDSGHNFCGLSRYDLLSDSWDHLTKETGLIDGRVHAIARVPNGALWVGTQYGVNRFVSASAVGAYFDWHDCGQPGPHCDPLWSYTVGGFFPDGDVMWLAIDLMQIGISPKPGGVARRNADGTTDTWNMDHGLPSHRAERVVVVGDTTWICSHNGVARLEAGSDTWVLVGQWPSRDIAATSDGSIWLATELGLRQLSPTGADTLWTTADGLPDSAVVTLATSGASVCAGTARGIACIDVGSGQLTVVYRPAP